MGHILIATLLICELRATEAPGLRSDPAVSEAGFALSETGYYQLRWQVGGDEQEPMFTLEESLTPDFVEPNRIYEGPDGSTSLSGRRDGAYYYRVRDDRGPWSESLKVVVQHHDLSKALVYLAVGAVVFLATAALVVAGHIAHRREGLGT